MKITQLVLVQNFLDEFKLLTSQVQRMPVEAGMLLVAGSNESKVAKIDHTYFQKGAGKLLHMTQWSIQGADLVHKLSQQGLMPTKVHVKAMHNAIDYCLATSKRGWMLQPENSGTGRIASSRSKSMGLQNQTMQNVQSCVAVLAVTQCS